MPLMSPRFANNQRLQAAYLNSPALYPGATGEAVQIVQKAFMDLGYSMPNSTVYDDNYEPQGDGIYGPETTAVVRSFETQWHLTVDPGLTGREVLDKLDELFPAPPRTPGQMPRCLNFTDQQEQTLRNDVDQAIFLSMRCVTALTADVNSGALDPSVCQLLTDTFATDGSDLSAVEPIRGAFVSFNLRMRAVELIHTVRHTPDARHFGYAAFVDFPNRGVRPYLNEIYVTDGYFDTIAPIKRQLTLIHEAFHLLVNTDGHPGSGDAYPDDRPMGIAYPQAINNAYCYDHFAEWL
jgi:peptidoglycan hydrolase-like protein with peptidoglycan-binding domain